MNTIKTLLTILVISLLSTPSWSATKDDLVQREGLYYKRFTDVPFTGKVTGQEQGLIKNGKRDGAWVIYRDDGQLTWRIGYKNGQFHGDSISYFSSNGQLMYKGRWKYGMKEGVWVFYNADGTVVKEKTGTFKDGVKISN